MRAARTRNGFKLRLAFSQRKNLWFYGLALDLWLSRILNCSWMLLRAVVLDGEGAVEGAECVEGQGFHLVFARDDDDGGDPVDLFGD